MKRILLILSAVFIGLASGLGFSYANAISPVADAEPDGARTVSAARVNTSANELLLQKLQALQDEMQLMRGKLEVQAHDLKLLDKQQRALYNDLDQRVASLATSKAAAPKSIANNTAAANPTASTIAAESATLPPESITDRQAYEAAYELIKNKQYTVAEPAMRTFIDAFPNSTYLANAHYWLGELYLNQGALDDALKQFSTITTRFPKSTKVPAAHLKSGIAYYDKGAWQKARVELEKVKQLSPNSLSAKLAAARLGEMDKQGL